MNCRTAYACTHVTKEACVDDYNAGETGKRTCTVCESCDITAPTLEELIGRVGNHYCLDIDDVYLVTDDNDQASYFEYTRLETNDCDEPTETEKEKWKKGELTLYSTSYLFAIEKRTVSPVNVNEFVEARIKYHF